MEMNELIEASAGTGKTQALAERLISLQRAGVKPQEIIALTFSRAAAGEIFERFASLLADRAADDPTCATMLREVIATQHLSQIGTLDSFLMRIVRSFPLELGLCGDLEMMDDYRAGQERARTSFSILRRTDKSTKRAFVEAFTLAMNREDVRSFVTSYREFIKDWHERVMAYPEASAWGVAERIWNTVPVEAQATEADLMKAADRLLATDPSDADLAACAEWARDFRGSFTGVKGLAKKFLEADDLFAGATIEISFNRKKRVYGGEQAAAIRALMKCVSGYLLRKNIELARGVYGLISVYERDYAKKVRATGKLVFSDVPRLILGLSEENRLALEYRMDARIRAWALDEFQDTSREQWKALASLIEEAKQSGGEKSVFIVGDTKQAIYGWRNGDVGIFEAEKESGAYHTSELAKTFRSCPAIIEAVNAVFRGGLIKQEFPEWYSPEHISAKPDQKGFVQCVEASGKKKGHFVEPVLNALEAVEPVRRAISTAILVRSNGMGEYLAAELKRAGVKDVVWEGESMIDDTPALQAFLDLVSLADHPGDKQAFNHFRTTPLAAVRYPAGVPSVTEVSAWAAHAFTSRGLVRVFRELRALLPKDPEEAWSLFTEERFTDFLRAAAEFELAMEPGVRLSDFATYLASKTKRNVAEPGKIKIMTIHRSKGLGFDYVILPLYESSSLKGESDGPLLGDGWILPDPGVRATRMFPELEAAREERQRRVEQEALCTYYVAMTRAKRAMTIVTQPAAKSGSSVYFSDLVRSAITDSIGSPDWYAEFGACEPEAVVAEAVRVAHVRRPREHIARRLPSLNLHGGVSAGSLFARQGRDAALAKGTAKHAAFEEIEWIDPQAPKNDFEREVLANGWEAAFVKRDASASVWRERSFEIFANGRWTSGQFDRVVFTGEGEAREAVVYDFKTNQRQCKESDAAFAKRMAERYTEQLAAYRTAVASLTGLPESRIKTALLLTETGAIVPCPA